jgi:hypothetical protein
MSTTFAPVRPRARALRAVSALAMLAATVGLGALSGVIGCGSAVVGGACNDGYEMCNGACVPSGACGMNVGDGSTATGDGPGDDGASDATVTGDSSGDDSAATSPDVATADGGDAGDDAADATALSDGASDASGDDSSDASSDVSGDASSDAGTDGATTSASDAGSDAPTDATFGADGATDGAVADASDASDAGATDAADASSTDAPPVDACPAPPYSTPDHCGSCATSCSGANPVCKTDGMGGYACAPACDVGQQLCGGACIDPQVDPNNCGSCGHVCPTRLCSGGKCRGATAGHVVVIGHDFASVTPVDTVAQVLVNAVYLPTRGHVRVLAFDGGWVDPAARLDVRLVLDAAGAVTGRSYGATTVSTSDDFLAKLNPDQTDVALVYDQTTAPTGALGPLGFAWHDALLAFEQAGGVVIALDGGGNAETLSLLNNSGILSVSAHASVTSLNLSVTAPGDAIGIGVLSPYVSPFRSAGFTTSEVPSATGFIVIAEPTSAMPVVVHKVVMKP